jgi:hypothetical protein
VRPRDWYLDEDRMQVGGVAPQAPLGVDDVTPRRHPRAGTTSVPLDMQLGPLHLRPECVQGIRNCRIARRRHRAVQRCAHSGSLSDGNTGWSGFASRDRRPLDSGTVQSGLPSWARTTSAPATNREDGNRRPWGRRGRPTGNQCPTDRAWIASDRFAWPEQTPSNTGSSSIA